MEAMNFNSVGLLDMPQHSVFRRMRCAHMTRSHVAC